ncbi:uncharacterized protein PRCAT00000406001 [Priceomyces carsonii]|uniref:uncharacterized protein n=1 Tax=Priceomyces carsonii TaxID=28549 RepID=UPI002EDABF0A|nr:unnamed protein product [Priceomyces carsonii]
MAHGQRQELVLLNDNTIISDGLLGSTSSFLSVVSHTQGTSPAWLINSLLENALEGTATLINKDVTKKQENRSEVLLVSFLHLRDFFVRGCKRQGLDLDGTKSFNFVDCFTDLFSEQVPDVTKAKDLVLEVVHRILKLLAGCSNDKKVVFIEGIEILLSSTNLATDNLLSHLLEINKNCNQLFVICSQDAPQFIDMNSTNADSPIFKITDFLTKLYYRSNMNLQLNPLATGRAKDITGCLTVSRGCLPYDPVAVSVVDRNYIYCVTKESNVVLYYR